MDTFETLTHRRSCRKFTDQPVEAEKLERIVEAGQYAPNGMGRQAATFVVITDPATIAKLSQMNAEVMGSKADPFYGGTAVIVVLADTAVPTHVEDGALAMGNLLNQAHAEGLGGIWIHRAKEEFESEKGKALLAEWGLPADGSLRGVGHCVLGYAAAPAAEPKPRRDNVVWVK